MDRFDDDRPRRRRRPRGYDSDVPCPNCGSHDRLPGDWPWYLGTVGAVICRPVICNSCDHEFDEKKPAADLAKRKQHLLFAINGIGLLGIVAVVGGLILWLN